MHKSVIPNVLIGGPNPAWIPAKNMREWRTRNSEHPRERDFQLLEASEARESTFCKFA